MPEQIDSIYVCHECSAIFLFKSDVEEHEQKTGHRKIRPFPLAA